MGNSLNRIVSILPKGEGFSAQAFGAVALCVRDFTYYSRYREQTTVISNVAGEGFEGIHYVPLPNVRWYENRTRSYARQCVEVILREQATLVEIHNRPNLLRLIAPKVKCKFVLHFHNDPQEIDYTRTPRERSKILERTDAVYCVSGYIRDRFAEGIDIKLHDKLHVVYNGIESPVILPEKENVITFAGRMTEGKGAKLFAEALRIALPQLPDWKAVMIGSRRHSVAEKLTPHEKEIAEVLQHVGEQARMPGFLSHTETLDYFARAAIAVVPSVWQEPFGRTAIEAMAYGCALISSGRGGLREVTAYAAATVNDLTAEKLADAIIMLAKNKNERDRLQSLARKRATYFSIADRTSLLDKVRDKVLEPY